MNNIALGLWLALMAIMPIIQAVQQCNIGLKMYSIESGQTVCAPFSSYGCIEACEWNTSCAATTHFKAFKGRRTYVSGMVLSEKQWILQCCASLGTIVQMNSHYESLCVWTSWVNSVEEGGSVRMNPPLSKNEYIRDVEMERLSTTGRVKLRLEICKFITQRTQCEREKMAVEERHHYSLLLLRLYRTQLLLNATSTLSDTKKEEAATAAIRSAATAPESQNRPGSAVFSVVSRIDDDHQVGHHHFRHSSLPHNVLRGAIAPSSPPRINGSLWNNYSGVPKAQILPTSEAHINAPLDTVSGFSIDLVPISQRQEITSTHRRRLATNQTRQTVMNKAAQTSDLEDLSIINETPLKASLHIVKLADMPSSSRNKWIARNFQTMTDAVNPSTTTLRPSYTTLPSTASNDRFTVALQSNHAKIAKQRNDETFVVASRPSLPPQNIKFYQRKAMNDLVQCCQNQAPGCRQLCTKDIHKDEVKRALLTQQCPPLSMTSVIACFPQFYDTAPVSTCCSASPNLPPQCLALCQPSFKPTLAHLSCIDHVNTIVECYRDLLR